MTKTSAWVNVDDDAALLEAIVGAFFAALRPKASLIVEPFAKEISSEACEEPKEIAHSGSSYLHRVRTGL